MNKRCAVFALCFMGGVGSLVAQAPAEKPLSEQEFLKKIDSIGTPPSRPKLGLEGTGLDEKKRPPAPPKAKGETTITAEHELTFDKSTNEAVFLGKVVVIDPEFKLECDRLDVFMKKKEEKSTEANPAPNGSGQKTPTPKTPTPKTPTPASPSPVNSPSTVKAGDADKDKPSSGGLDHAIADADAGKVVTITQDKIESDGSVSKSVGHGRRATYDAKTGDVVLTGMPNVQQGINLVVATDESTVMTLNRNGIMHAVGPTKSILKDSSTIDGK